MGSLGAAQPSAEVRPLGYQDSRITLELLMPMAWAAHHMEKHQLLCNRGGQEPPIRVLPGKVHP